MLSSLLHGWRAWKHAKGVAILAIVALSAGIGSATAIYTVVHAVILEPLPYARGERFITIFAQRTTEPGQYSGNSLPDLDIYRQRAHSFDAFGAYRPIRFNLTALGQPQIVNGIAVAPGLVTSFGVNPAMGRWFADPAHDESGNSVVVLSHQLWQRIGADPGIVGRTVTLDRKLYTVRGVMPGWFQFPITGIINQSFATDLWVPLDVRPTGQNSLGADASRAFAGYFCFARLRPGITVDSANKEIKRIAAQIAREYPAEHASYTATAISVKEAVVQRIRPTLFLLLGAALALLGITCANVAGLLLARSVTRARETATRVALGAQRMQLALQFFFEGLLLALAGALGGTIVSYVLVQEVLALATDEIPRADSIRVNGGVLAFALAVAIGASLLFSLAPLWQASRTRPNDVLSEGVRATSGARSRTLSRVLVMAEIALAFTLLSVGLLLFSQLSHLFHIEPGFDPHHLLTFRLNAPDNEYPDDGHLTAYQGRLLAALQNLPGVESAGFANQIALAGCCFTTEILPEGQTLDPNHRESISFLEVSQSFFRTMRIPLIEGRLFDAHDNDDKNLVVVIDLAAARHYWPTKSAIGSYLRLNVADGPRVRVVGVVGDVRNRSLSNATTPEIYFSNLVASVNDMWFIVRSPLPPQTLLPAIRRAIAEVNPTQPIFDVATMEDRVAASLGRQRLRSFTVGFFAAAALLMAGLGVYGVVSYSVRQRTVEIGTRMALGASNRAILRLVINDGLRMAGIGILSGGVLTVVALWLARTQLQEVPTIHPWPMVLAVATLTALTAVGCFFPAWRAVLLSPMVAIRNDAGSFWQTARAGVRRLTGQLTFASPAEEQAASGEAELLAEVAEVGRHAESFGEALREALDRLRERIGAESLALFVQKGPEFPYRCARVTPDACADWTLPPNALLVSRLRYYPGVLPIDREGLGTLERWAHENAPMHVPELETLREIGAAAACRIAVKNEISGILFAGRPAHRREYSVVDKRLMRGVAAQFAMMLEISRLSDRIGEQDRLRRELAMAGEVQKRLFPDRSPQASNVQLTGICLPARGVGGDYYDFLDLGNGRIAIALADVAGKGIAAALVMSVVQASLRSLTGRSPAGAGTIPITELAASMNRLLYGSTGPNSYATFFYAEVDSNGRRLHYVNAGHNPPFLLRVGTDPREIEELAAGGTIIGMFPQSAYDEGAVDLEAGDVLLVFTDGVPEALNPIDEEFGEDRLRDLLRGVAHYSLEEMSSRILEQMKLWISDAAQYDDLTFLLMKVS